MFLRPMQPSKLIPSAGFIARELVEEEGSWDGRVSHPQVSTPSTDCMAQAMSPIQKCSLAVSKDTYCINLKTIDQRFHIYKCNEQAPPYLYIYIYICVQSKYTYIYIYIYIDICIYIYIYISMQDLKTIGVHM